MKPETSFDIAHAVIDPRLPDLRRLMAHTQSAYIFTPTPGGAGQDEAGGEIDLNLDSVRIIHTMVDLRCAGGRALALVRAAPGVHGDRRSRSRAARFMGLTAPSTSTCWPTRLSCLMGGSTLYSLRL